MLSGICLKSNHIPSIPHAALIRATRSSCISLPRVRLNEGGPTDAVHLCDHRSRTPGFAIVLLSQPPASSLECQRPRDRWRSGRVAEDRPIRDSRRRIRAPFEFVNLSSRQLGFRMPIIPVDRVSISDGHFKVAFPVHESPLGTAKTFLKNSCGHRG